MKATYLILLVSIAMSLGSCKKFLDEKPDRSLSTPDKLQDLQALLDGAARMNRAAIAPMNASDEFYLQPTVWTALPKQFDKDCYVWSPETQNDQDWEALYIIVYYANTILDNIDRAGKNGTAAEYNSIKGSALFFRAHAYYQLSQTFAAQFDPNTAESTKGIVLRGNSDFSIPSKRSTIKETFEQILGDLNEAKTLLPIDVLYKTRVNRASAFALMARTYLIMGDYDNALNNASSALELNNRLLDFNALDARTTAPFPLFNDEVVFYCNTNLPLVSVSSRAIIDTALYRSYQDNDLRKSVYFSSNGKGGYFFKGSLNGSTSNIFNGIANDELYLIKAECEARTGNAPGSMRTLNTLIRKRFKTGSFTDFSAANSDEALQLVLAERKKELIYRGLRFSDIRRLNMKGAAIFLTRNLDGKIYRLEPNDKRFTWLIPQKVISLTELEQNER